MKKIAVVCIAMSMLVSLTVSANELITHQPNENSFNEALSGRAAEQQLRLDVSEKEEMLARDLDYLVAPIKSADDLSAFLSKSDASALDALSAPARERFVSSIGFNGRGVTHFAYEDLRKELTPTQVYKVLALFGMQSTAPWVGYARVETALDRDIIESIEPRTGGKCVSIQSAPGKSATKCTSGPPFLGYECKKTGTCSKSNGDICTSNC